jgi:hypothetical protein
VLGISELEGYEGGLNERGIFVLVLLADCLAINSYDWLIFVITECCVFTCILTTLVLFLSNTSTRIL